MVPGHKPGQPLSHRQPKVEEEKEESFPAGQELLLKVPPAPQLQAE